MPRLKYLVCKIPAELAQKYADWGECGYLKISVEGQNRYVTLDATNSLELLTRPEGDES